MNSFILKINESFTLKYITLKVLDSITSQSKNNELKKSTSKV